MALVADYRNYEHWTALSARGITEKACLLLLERLELLDGERLAARVGFAVMEFLPEAAADMGWLAREGGNFDDFSKLARAGVVEGEKTAEHYNIK